MFRGLQEYGLTAEEKAEIARLIGTPLVRKIRGDLRHQSGDFVHQLDPEWVKMCCTCTFIECDTGVHSILSTHTALISSKRYSLAGIIQKLIGKAYFEVHLVLDY